MLLAFSKQLMRLKQQLQLAGMAFADDILHDTDHDDNILLGDSNGRPNASFDLKHKNLLLVPMLQDLIRSSLINTNAK